MKFPCPFDIVQNSPSSLSQKEFIDASRTTLKQILKGIDPRLVLIVGPCSIHDEKSCYEYAEKLLELTHEVSSQFFIVMRSYFEKPRTKTGWKGLLYDPDLNGLHDIEKGIRQARKILLHLADLKIPTGSELLELNTAHYYADLLSWGCIGARTSASQPHRQLASSFPFPIGFKNTTDGNIEIALNGILSANSPHTFLGTNFFGNLDQIETIGNKDCHLVLRGGIHGPNYDPQSIQRAWRLCESLHIKNKILVDCAHDNSQKVAKRQELVFDAVLDQILTGNSSIFGLMLESHIHSGSQPLAFPLRYGVSITDPCLNWSTTRTLILKAAEKLEKQLVRTL